MNSLRLFVDRPVFATVLNILVMLVGVVALTKLTVREYPNIDVPVVSVVTRYTGASAYIVESQITDVLEENDRAFSPKAGIFQDERERNSAKALFQRIGASLEKNHPLGHENSEALVVFPSNAPNNTLPVFYKTGRRYEGKLWNPLFPRV